MLKTEKRKKQQKINIGFNWIEVTGKEKKNINIGFNWIDVRGINKKRKKQTPQKDKHWFLKVLRRSR